MIAFTDEELLERLRELNAQISSGDAERAALRTRLSRVLSDESAQAVDFDLDAVTNDIVAWANALIWEIEIRRGEAAINAARRTG